MRKWHVLNWLCISLGLCFLYGTAKNVRLSVDVSQNEAKQLSPEIQSLLQQMNEQDVSAEKGATVVHIYAFSSRSNAFYLQKNAYSKRFLEMIDRLGYQNIQTHFVDFDKEREVAERLRIKEYGKWVIQFGSRRMELAEHQIYRSAKDDVEFVGMSNLAKSFRILLQKRQYKIGFVRGHGEDLISNTSVDGLSDWGQYLEQGGFVLEDISHVSSEKLAEVDIVVLAAPKQRLSEIESQTLYDYFEMSGKIVYFDDVGLPDAPLFDYLGMSKMEGIATDTDSLFPYWDRPIVKMQPHSITRNFLEQRFQLIFSQASALQISKSNHASQSLLSLSSGGWMERGGEFVSGQAQFDKGIDVRGKATLSQIFEHGSNGKFLWIGDMDFLRNGILTEFPLHASFLQRVMLYMVEEDFKPTQPVSLETIRMTNEQFTFFRLLALGFLPLLVLMVGVFQYARRRGA